MVRNKRHTVRKQLHKLEGPGDLYFCIPHFYSQYSLTKQPLQMCTRLSFLKLQCLVARVGH